MQFTDNKKNKKKISFGNVKDHISIVKRLFSLI